MTTTPEPDLEPTEDPKKPKKDSGTEKSPYHEPN